MSEKGKRLFPNPANLLTPGETNGYALSIWANILEKLQSYTNETSLLEVGIGKGELLAVALELGYEVEAVEISERAAQKIADMLDISVWNGDFLDYRSEKRFPVIIMGDVIEHVTDPAKALRNAYHLLSDDGVLWLSTPNFESSFSRIRKFRDPMWQEPSHISYFSYRGFAALASKCGFTVQDYAVSNRYNGSMELILTKTSEQNS